MITIIVELISIELVILILCLVVFKIIAINTTLIMSFISFPVIIFSWYRSIVEYITYNLNFTDNILLKVGAIILVILLVISFNIVRKINKKK